MPNQMTIFSLAVVAMATALSAPLRGAPVELAGTQGKFDFIKVDSAQRRLLACHTQNGSLDVIDLDSCKLIKSIPTGSAQGVAIDRQGGRYFVSASRPPQMVTIDATTLTPTGTVPLPGPADLVAYHAGSDRVYVCNDEKPEIWIIDPKAKTISQTLTFPEAGMEDLGFAASGQFLFQNLKDSSKVAKLDVKSGTIVAQWPTDPAIKPHGMTIVPESGAILVAGGTGKLVLMSATDGRILASTDIAEKVDEIAYDPAWQRIYAASGKGVISVSELKNNVLTKLAEIPSALGAHSIAVDPQTHAVWIAYGKEAQSFVEKSHISESGALVP